MSDEGPDPRNQPLGRGATVTDWRPYTADHRHIDGTLVHACVRMNGAGCAGRTFIHDPLDSVSAAAALSAASEAGIDLAYAGPPLLQPPTAPDGR